MHCYSPNSDERECTTRKRTLISLVASASLTVSAAGVAVSAQDKYTLEVPGGLAFSEFRGYEDWSVIAISQNGPMIDMILGNPEMIAAFREGVPDNGKPFPDGAKMAKIHWMPKKQESYPGQPTVPGTQHDVDFMVKDSKRFVDSAGWGWAEFEYDAASDTFRPGDSAARTRRQVRVRVPHVSEDERLRLYRVREKVSLEPKGAAGTLFLSPAGLEQDRRLGPKH